MPLALQWLVRDIVLAYECDRVTYSHASFAMAFLFLPHTAESENTRTSVLNRFLIGDSSRHKFFKDSDCQFRHNEIPENSAATFVRSSSMVCTVSMIVSVLRI